MKLKSAKSKFESRLGGVSHIFKNVDDPEYMCWVFSCAVEYESVADWLRDLALEEFYKQKKKK